MASWCAIHSAFVLHVIFTSLSLISVLCPDSIGPFAVDIVRPKRSTRASKPSLRASAGAGMKPEPGPPMTLGNAAKGLAAVDRLVPSCER